METSSCAVDSRRVAPIDFAGEEDVQLFWCIFNLRLGLVGWGCQKRAVRCFVEVLLYSCEQYQRYLYKVYIYNSYISIFEHVQM